ncbi:MAG: polysaccharide deacetylase family protein [Chitinophagales bacterium]
MYIPKTPDIAKRVFPRLTWEEKTDEKELFLTFDDGPTPGVTEWVLDELDKYNAKATFFCLGKNVVLFPDLFEDTLRRGHAVGNHTYNHLNGWKTPKTKYLKDIESCEQVFHSELFRPPYGKIKPGTRSKILEKYKVVMWDVMSYDFDNNIGGEDCCDNVTKNAKSGSIVVFHDSEKAKDRLKICLPKVLEYYAKQDFSFKALK